jgi:hypothetical protein
MPTPVRLSRRALLNGACASLLTALAVRSGTLHAQTAAATAPTPGQTLPAALVSELPGLRSLGTARLRFWGLDVYDARLWVGADFKAESYAQSPFALELNYARSLSGKLIAERSLQEMQRQGAIAPEAATTWLAAMVGAFPDVKAGDRIVGVHVPGNGARFWHNGQPRPGLNDAEFSRRFFGIWLSEATSEPKLRKELLGLASP